MGPDPLRHHRHYRKSGSKASPYTGALVIIAQRAQTRTDRANAEAGAGHREELAQYQSVLLEKNTELTEQIHALAERLTELTEQVHRATCRPAPHD